MQTKLVLKTITVLASVTGIALGQTTLTLEGSRGYDSYVPIISSDNSQAGEFHRGDGAATLTVFPPTLCSDRIQYAYSLSGRDAQMVTAEKMAYINEKGTTEWVDFVNGYAKCPQSALVTHILMRRSTRGFSPTYAEMTFKFDNASSFVYHMGTAGVSTNALTIVYPDTINIRHPEPGADLTITAFRQLDMSPLAWSISLQSNAKWMQICDTDHLYCGSKKTITDHDHSASYRLWVSVDYNQLTYTKTTGQIRLTMSLI